MVKRKRENPLWELDLLESKAAALSSNGANGNIKRTRLVRTKLAVERMKKKQAAKNKNEEGLTTNGEIEQRTIELKRKLVEQRVYYWTKELVRGLKKAKTSETQKIVRKLKDARSKDSSDLVAKYERELRLIKALDPSAVASSHLIKKLQKEKFLVESNLLPESPSVLKPESTVLKLEDRLKKNKAEEPEVDQKKEEDVRLDIIARLFRVKAVQAIISSGIEGISTAVETALNTKRKKKKEPKVSASAEKEEVADDNDDDDEDSGNEAEEDDGSDDEDELDMEQYAGLVANSDESDNENDSSDSEDAPIDYNEISSEEPSDDELDHESPQSESGDEESLQKQKKASKAEKKEKKLAAKTNPPELDRKAKTIVLPSLSAGYISPGSDDDMFSDEEGRRGPASAKPRKNRRGQRARQKIWEQKYGKKAAHIAKEEAARKAKEEEKQRKYLERRARREMETSASNANNTPLGEPGKKEAKSEKPIHPSWQAKQAKSKPVAFKGKKVVFE